MVMMIFSIYLIVISSKMPQKIYPFLQWFCRMVKFLKKIRENRFSLYLTVIFMDLADGL